MRRVPIAAGAMLMAALSCVAVRAQNVARPGRTASAVPNTLSAVEKAQGWALLFDGRTTNGWRGFRLDTMPSGWEVRDGALTRFAPGSDIVTTKQYDNNFELQLDWKMDKGGNSGVFFDVVEDTSLHAIYESGPEFQILDNEAYADVTTPKTMTGANYALHAPIRDMRKPLGEWNHVRIIVSGNHVEHWMNGVKLLEYEMGSDDWKKRVADSKFKDMPKYGIVRRGYIGLQNHDATVAFRNIKLRKLGNNR